MTPSPPVSDPSVLMRWMALEMGRINDGVVAERKRLSECSGNRNPHQSPAGEKSLPSIKAAYASLVKDSPSRSIPAEALLIFYFDSTVADSFFLTDSAALEALQMPR